MAVDVTAEKVLTEFQIPDGNYRAVQNNNGLINRSFAIVNGSDEPLFFLQKIDDKIFRNVDSLMNNISELSNHFSRSNHPPEYLNLIATKDNRPYYFSDSHGYWRMYQFEKGQTYFKADCEEMASEAGRTYGRFLAALFTVDMSKMSTTIEGFHDINLRYNQFNTAKKTAKPERLIKAKDWIMIIEEHILSMRSYYNDLVDLCPARVTHNDTKLSNLLFDEHKKGRIVVDYDTIMPGYIALDFGDAVRTICSTTLEDDGNFENIMYSLELYKAFYQSFIDSFDGELVREELIALTMAISYMPFLMGLRMLTDYLNNDLYYSIDYEDHNLIRAGNQFTLFLNGLDLQKNITFKN